MTDRTRYSYKILKYVHDITTGEFINVGVFLHVPSSQILLIKTRNTIGRIKYTFPDLNRSAFLSSIKSIEFRLKAISKHYSGNQLLDRDLEISELASRILPNDYASLQWSTSGGGLTDNPEKTMSRLFERFVTKYDAKVTHRRSDDDIWRPVRDLMAERKLTMALEPKQIAGEADTIVFSRAWKNGVWHAFEPVSLDLADADGIKDKARRWLGHLAAVNDGAEPFKVYFILGRPQSSELQPAYNSAKAILERAPGGPQIFEEAQISDFVDAVEDEYRAHEATKLTYAP